MIISNFTFKSKDGLKIFVYKWEPEDIPIKGILQISHGMAETAQRYERLAKFLVEKGYIVYAHDHRGHGKTAGSIEALGYLGDTDGFKNLIKDIYKLTLIIKKENPNVPIFLLGHSMGSFAAQRYIMLYGQELNGLILSGSNGSQGIILDMGIKIAKREIKKHGEKFQSKKLNALIFGNYNLHFMPTSTPFDWLSRDKEEVRKFIEDPYCGTLFTAGFFYEFLSALKIIEDKNNFNTIPTDLPIYIFSGDQDPVGNFGKGVIKLYKRYKDLGVKNLNCRLYKGGRHEMLNEINKEIVMEDIGLWLDLQIETLSEMS